MRVQIGIAPCGTALRHVILRLSACVGARDRAGSAVLPIRSLMLLWRLPQAQPPDTPVARHAHRRTHRPRPHSGACADGYL